MTISYRMVTAKEIPQLADLRWRLQFEDEPISDRDEYNRFIANFLGVYEAEWNSKEIVHWVAVNDEKVVAVISVEFVHILPRPGDLRGRWGYLSNSYTLPEVRNFGVGAGLLAAVKDWAVSENLELLVVWPSNRSYSFYERAGFQRYPDPLVLKLNVP